MPWEIPGCPACGLDVPYRTPRARCLECGLWTHRPGGGIGDGECLQPCGRCHSCAVGRPNLGPVRRFLLEDVEVGEDSLESGLVVMASALWAGADEGKVAEITGLDPAAVKLRADRLRASGVWLEDGTVALDGRGPDELLVGICLASMCADGIVVRSGP